MEVVSDRTKPRVKDYMTRDVATVSPDETVGEVARRIAESDEHSGFPVCERRRVEGFISARDLLLADDDDPIFKIMATELLVAHPDMKVNDAARVILRSGIQKLPSSTTRATSSESSRTLTSSAARSNARRPRRSANSCER